MARTVMREQRRPRRVTQLLTPTRAGACTLFVAVLIAHVLMVIAVGNRGWDDGSITAAFARTFADTGKISLTPFSEVVEGFSSLFWFALLAATDSLVPLDFDGMIAASQLWSAVFSAVGAVILFRLLRVVLRRAAMALSFVVFVSAAFLSETANGMEMTVLSALALSMVWVIGRRQLHPVALISLGAVAPWVRFEAGAYLLVAAGTFAMLSRDYRRAGAIAGGALSSLIVITAVRLSVFGSAVPNTMLAKRWAPYPKGGSIGEQLLGSKYVVEELIFVMAPAVILAVVALAGTRLPHRRMWWALFIARCRQPAVGFILGYVVAVAGFNLAIGPNWGYLGRMEQSVLPLMVVLVVYGLPVAMPALEVPWRLATAIAALLVLTVAGLGLQGLALRWHPERFDHVTPAAIRATGQAVDELRVRLGLPTVTVLMPDVGGSGLCCRQLAILDLGLLTNSELAHNGYSSLEQVIETRAPDVIQTHSVWSTASGIYALGYFRENYTAVVVNRSWLYLRNDHLAALIGDCHPILAKTGDFMYGADAIDEQYARALGRRFVCQLE